MNRYPVFSALLVCGASGAVFSVLRAPLPWLIGPLLAARVAPAPRNLPFFLAIFFCSRIVVKFAPLLSRKIRLAAVSVLPPSRHREAPA